MIYTRSYFILILCLCYLAPNKIKAQVIKGFVRDSKTKSPIEFAYVSANDTINYVTNPEGSFTIAGLNKENLVRLRFQMLGYKLQIITFKTKSDTVLNIFLEETSVLLQEVFIKEKRQKPFEAKDIVDAAIDSLRSRGKKTKASAVSGYYSQKHYSMPLLNYNDRTLPNLDSVNTYHYLIQANIAVSHNAKVNSITILNLRRSDDYRRYKVGYPKGKGRSFSMQYVSNNSPAEKIKAVEREKKLYDLYGFFMIDPIANYTTQVVSNDEFYLKAGTYGYLNEDFTKRHSLKLEGIIDYDGKKVAKIKILPSSKSYEHGTLGKRQWIPVGYLYIRLDDFGILRMEYSYILNPKKKDFEAFAGRIITGIPVLFKDVILYQDIKGVLSLAYLNRFQGDIDARIDEDSPRTKYYFVEREYITSKFQSTSDDYIKTKFSSLYDPYIYEPKYWDEKGLVSLGFKEYSKIVKDLESHGKSLQVQFKENTRK